MSMKKNLIWFIISVAIIAGGYFGSLYFQNQIFIPYEFSAHPLVILLLCVAVGWLKRDSIQKEMNHQTMLAEPIYISVGLLVIFISLLMPLSTNPVFVLFKFLLTFVGLFFVFFGAAAYLPSLLLFVYGFSVSFPILLNEFFGTQYSLITTSLVAHTTGLFYPVDFNGQTISTISSSGVQSMIYIDAECSGSASLAIFLTVFALMMIDIKPRNDRILPLFLFGIIGTSLQNILRLVVLLATNYHFGSDSMWLMHSYAGYILFPVWFAIFIYVYLKVGIEKPQIPSVSELGKPD